MTNVQSDMLRSGMNFVFDGLEYKQLSEFKFFINHLIICSTDPKHMLAYGNGNMDFAYPDNFLALREVQPWCAKMEEVCLESGQCLMISHHPEVIDYFADDCAIWISKLKSGESIVTENSFKAKNCQS